MKKNKKEKKDLLELILDTLFNSLKYLTKAMIKLIIFILISLLKLSYKLIKIINKLIAKGFNKLPRLLKLSIVYSLIGLSAIGIVGIVNPKVEVHTIVQTQVVEKTIAKENNKQIKDNNKIDLHNKNANNIYNQAIAKGLTQDQALLAVSISRHETGNWKSVAFKSDNNFGGIMGSNGLIHYDTYNEGLNEFLGVLKKYYFDMGLTTIAEIGAKYCPVGAKK